MGVEISTSPATFPVVLPTDHIECGQGQENHGWPRKVWLLVGEAQLAGYLLEQEGCPLVWGAGIQ